MDKNIYQSNLKSWNDDKGFGFVESKNGKGDVFLHISALKKMSRRPVVGDIIYYQIHTDNDGKNRAVNAKIDGVSEIQVKVNRKTTRNKKNDGWLSKFITFILLVLIGSVIYNKFFEKNVSVNNPTTINSTPAKQVNYSCSGKVYCSEMTSCDEAIFYQNNCLGTKMDGDGDGIPCESQWCSW